MSKKSASERRKSSRAKHLENLAASCFENFCAEWHTRMNSWLAEARRRTTDIEGIFERKRPAFEVVAYAKNALEDANIDETVLENHNSINMLEHACTKSVASLYDKKLYHLKSITGK